jgi:hypothetical protein
MRRGFIACAIIFLIIVLGLIVFGSTPAVSAQGPSSDFTGIDVVFVIDQSGSMCGKRCGSTHSDVGNDKNDLRFWGTEKAIEILGNQRRSLLAKVRAQYGSGATLNINFRAAVVNFGSTVSKVNFGTASAPQYIVTLAANSDEEWAVQLKNLQDKLSPTTMAGRNLGLTDFQLAFQEARVLFDQMEQTDKSKRLKAIIVMTDGSPYAERGSYLDDANSPGWQFPVERYMQDLQSYIKARFPSPTYTIIAGLMLDSKEDYWSKTEVAWKSITNDHIRKAENNETFGSFLQQVIWDMVQQLGIKIKVDAVQCGETSITPYLDSVIFTFNKPTPESRVLVYRPDGSLVKDGDVGVKITGEAEPIEDVVVENPVPGKWLLKCPPLRSKDPIIFKQTLEAVLSSPSPSGPQGQFIPVRIEYRLLDRRGNLVIEDPRYPIAALANIRWSGAAQDVRMEKQPGSTYAGTFTPLIPGVHTILFKVDTQIDGSRVTILDNEGKDSFIVAPIRPELKTPLTPGTLLVPTKASVVLNGVLSDGSKVPIKPDPANPPSLQLSLTAPGESPRTLPMTAEADGSFSTIIVPVRKGAHQLSAKVDFAAGGMSPTDIGVLNVDTPTIKWQGNNAPRQHKVWQLAYDIRDRVGNPLTLAPGYELQPIVTLTSAGQTWTVSLVRAEAQFIGSFTPTTPGAYTIKLNVNAKDSSGATLMLAEDSLASTVTVLPTTIVRPALLNSTSVVESNFFPFLPTPFTIEMELRDLDGQRINDPAQVLVNPTAPVFAVTVTDPKGANRSSELSFVPTGTPSRYRATTNTFTDLGPYQIRVQVVGALKPDHAYEPEEFGFTMELTPNRGWIIVPPVLIFFLIGAIVVGYREWRSRQYPVQGTLTIIDSKESPVVVFDLNSIKRDRFHFKGGQLQSVGIIELSGHREPKQNTLKVTVVQDNKQKSLMDQPVLGGMRFPLLYDYWLEYTAPMSGQGLEDSYANWRT